MEQVNGKSSTRMLTALQAQEYTGMGRHVFRRWADKIGATRKFSEKMIRYDKEVIDAVLDQMGKEGAQK